MTKEQIFKRLDEMLANEKSKKFLTHLVKSYLPVNKVSKVTTKPEKPFKCVITNEKLFCLDDIIKGISSDEFKNSFIEKLKIQFDVNPEKQSDMFDFLGDKKMGLVGEKTDTFMSVITYQYFYEWAMVKVLNGDKHMNWVVKSMMGNGFSNKKEVKQKVNRTTYSLGDVNDVLLKLKNKMDSEV